MPKSDIMTSQDSPAKPTHCPRCNSTQFQLSDFVQYQIFPGGGYQPCSRPRQAAVCLCGYSISTKSLNSRNPEDRSFKESIDSARESCKRKSSDQLLEGLRRDFIDRAEFQELRDQINILANVLEQIRKADKEKPPHKP